MQISIHLDLSAVPSVALALVPFAHCHLIVPRHFWVVCAAGLFAVGGSTACAAPGWSREASAQYSFNTFGRELGLPGTVVSVAVQTRDGYLWVGTPAGLGRFDGVRFVGFHPSNIPALPSDLIHCLREDRAGTLWIGTGKGLVRYRDGHFAATELTGVAVRALAEDREGNVWAGTLGHGVHVFRGDRMERFRADSIPADGRVRALFVDSADRVWVALEKSRGVLRSESGAIRSFDAGDASFSEILSICEHPRGTLWFGTQRNGLFRLVGDELTHFGAADGVTGKPIFDIQRARDGGLWLAAGVLQHVRDPARVAVTSISGLPNENVRAVCEDSEGGVWLCASAEGLTRMHETQYRLISSDDGLPGNNVKTVSEDRAGNLWLAVQGEGVVQVIAGDGVISERSPAGFPGPDPAVVFPARDGSVWAGTNSHLWVRREGAWKQYSDLRFVRGLYEDRQGAMWVGTESTGVFRHEQGQFSEVKTSAGGSIRFATSFGEAADGTMVIGTWRSGIYEMRAGGTTVHDHAHGLPSDEVRAVYSDDEKRLWVGFSGRGLAVFDGGRWLNPDLLTQALGGQVSAIAEDERGRLWLGTLAGVVWAQKDELLAWMRDGTSAAPIHALAVGDKTRAIPVWSGGQPVVWRTAAGNLLFATRRGVVAVDPRRAAFNRVPPPVHVERVFVDRRAVDPTAAVRMPAGVRSLTIDYTALSFVQPARVRFSYKLAGYDAGWVDAGARRTAYYNRLPPGEYSFQVRACNSDGVWNTAGAQVAVIQLPHFYETRWFYALFVAGAGLLGWSLYRWSHRQLRFRLERLEHEHAMENERRRIAQDLHDDLGASLTEIGLFAEAARRTATPEARPQMYFLSERVRTLVGSLDAIVWAVNPANDSLDQLVAYVGEIFQELFRHSGIRCRLEIAADIPRYALTAEERSNLFLTAKEAMNNILKHSGATEAWLRIAMVGGELRLRIADNGRGFDPAAPAAVEGNGLANMRARLQRMRGTIGLRSIPGQGTEIEIVVSFAGRTETAEPS